jgi:hypothetical protein
MLLRIRILGGCPVGVHTGSDRRGLFVDPMTKKRNNDSSAAAKLKGEGHLQQHIDDAAL